MPLDKFVLLIVVVVAAAAATVWVGAMVVAAIQVPIAGPIFILPGALIGYVLWRVVSERLKNKEDDHYDSIEK